MKRASLIAALLLAGCGSESKPDIQAVEKPRMESIRPRAALEAGLFVYAYVYEIDGRTIVVSCSGGVLEVSK
jgi:uncharacterized lipoprotein YmbA